LKYFSKSLNENPKNLTTLYSRAILYNKLGNYEKAIEDYLEALFIESKEKKKLKFFSTFGKNNPKQNFDSCDADFKNSNHNVNSLILDKILNLDKKKEFAHSRVKIEQDLNNFKNLRKKSSDSDSQQKDKNTSTQQQVSSQSIDAYPNSSVNKKLIFENKFNIDVDNDFQQFQLNCEIKPKPQESKMYE
jgi:tetratricopeptide (TPR) repeat protein